MVSMPKIADLLPPLFEGGFETPLWKNFLDALRARTAADYASLIFRPPAPTRPSLMHLYSGACFPPVVEQRYRERLHALDPVDYHDLAEGRVYALADLFSAGDPAHAEYRQALLSPSGMNDFRLMRVAEPGGLSVWLSISRRAAAFGAAEGGLIAALTPYLRAALRNFAAIEREKFNASVASDMIRRLNFGWATLDANGRILETDIEARSMLSDSGILRRSANGRLAARDAELDREIAAAIKTLAASPQGRPRALVLSREPWADMLLVPVHKRAVPAHPAAAMIAYLHGDRWSSADRCEQLAELFQLLPSEARLVLALSRGMTIAEAAAELGLTVETARSYSKKIYAKTGARGQPDLVRFIHRSVLAIA